jgi:hypothetical protein
MLIGPGIGTGRLLACPNFSPLSLGSALLAWYDGADASTLFTDVGGTTLANVNGQVACWKDKSGNSNHCTQATASFRPTRGNGDVLTFTGTHRLLCIDFAQPTQVQPYTIISVGTNKTDSSSETDVNTPRCAFNRANATSVSMHAAATYAPAGAPDLNERRIKQGIYNGATSVIKVDGVTIGTSGNAGTNGLIGAAPGGAIANFLVTGTGTTPLGRREGLCEQLYIAGIMSAPVEAAMIAYLTTKWLT